MAYFQEAAFRRARHDMGGDIAIGGRGFARLAPVLAALAIFAAVVALPLLLGTDGPAAPKLEDWRGNSAALVAE